MVDVRWFAGLGFLAIILFVLTVMGPGGCAGVWQYHEDPAPCPCDNLDPVIGDDSVSIVYNNGQFCVDASRAKDSDDCVHPPERGITAVGIELYVESQNLLIEQVSQGNLSACFLGPLDPCDQPVPVGRLKITIWDDDLYGGEYGSDTATFQFTLQEDGNYKIDRLQEFSD